MPTASMFSKLVTSTGAQSKSLEVYARTLAGAVYAGKELDSWEGNKWTDRGEEMEDAARNLYMFAKGVEIEQVGFITDDKKRWGCSPDGLVGKDGMAEFKCLKAENHIKVIVDHKKTGKTPTAYIQQTQGQVMIVERKWCDLVFYHPELPLYIIQQEINAKVVCGLEEALPIVIKKREQIVAVLTSIYGDKKEDTNDQD